MNKINNKNINKNTIAAVVLNGESYKSQIQGDIIIAVDGGYEKTHYADIFVGDKDSVKLEITCNEQILLNVEKDATDCEVAIDYLIEKGVKNINFYGVLGGRIDHILTNLAVMAKCVKNGVKVTAYCNDCDIYMISDNLQINITKNSIISLSPFTDKVHIISLEGVKWELFDKTIYKDSSLTLSNIADKNKIRLIVDFGIVMVIVNK